MMDSRDDGLNFDDNNRLPWLETADGQEGTDGGSLLKIVFMVVFGLALLAQGQAVKAVAAQVGYGNATAFARAFQRATRQSPSAWQMDHLGQS